MTTILIGTVLEACLLVAYVKRRGKKNATQKN